MGLLDDMGPMGLLGAHLMAGTSPNFGVNLGNALIGANQDVMVRRKMDRDSAQSEFAQMVGTWKLLKDQDQRARAMATFTGAPYTPNPTLVAIEAKLGHMTGAQSPPLAGGSRPQGLLNDALGNHGGLLNEGSQTAGDGPMSLDQMPLAAQSQGTPATQSPRPMPGSGLAADMSAQGRQPDLRQLARAAGIPDAIAMEYLANGKEADLYKAITKALAPQNGPAGITRINPATGLPEILGGNATPGQVPFTRGADGQLRAQPIKGAAEEVARAEGLKAGATEAAKAPYQFQQYPLGPGGAPQVMSVEEMRRREATNGQPNPGPGEPNAQPGRPPGAPAYSVPPQVQAGRDDQRMQILLQERAALAAQGKTDPALEREIQLAQRGQGYGGPAGGLTGTNPIAADNAKDINADFVKNAYRPTMDAAKSADVVLGRVETLRRNGILSSTGWGTNAKAYAASVLGAMGVPDAGKYAGDVQTFRSTVMERNWELLNAAKGIQTEGDAQRAMQTFAQLENTPRANAFILDLTAATQRLAKEKAAYFAQEVQRRKGSGDLSGIEADWQQRAPSLWEMPELKGRWGDGDRATKARNVGPLVKNVTALYKAREAIKAGRSREAVIQRLEEMGYSSEGL